MDLNALVSWAGHNPYVVFAAGLACSNAKTLLHYAVLVVFKVPLLRAWLVGHPQEALDRLDAFRDEVREDIQDLAKAHVEASGSSVAASEPSKTS